MGTSVSPCLQDPSLPTNARGTAYRFAAFGPADQAVAYTVRPVRAV